MFGDYMSPDLEGDDRVYIEIPSLHEASEHRFNSARWSLLCSLYYVKGQSNFEHQRGVTQFSWDAAAWRTSRILNHPSVEPNTEPTECCLLCCCNRLPPGGSQRNLYIQRMSWEKFVLFFLFFTLKFLPQIPKALWRAWAG